MILAYCVPANLFNIFAAEMITDLWNCFRIQLQVSNQQPALYNVLTEIRDFLSSTLNLTPLHFQLSSPRSDLQSLIISQISLSPADIWQKVVQSIKPFNPHQELSPNEVVHVLFPGVLLENIDLSQITRLPNAPHPFSYDAPGGDRKLLKLLLSNVH